MKLKFSSVDEYLAGVSEEKRKALEALRKTIRSVAPDAEECISYQLPAFKQKRMLVAFGATKEHCAFYLMSSTVLDGFIDKLEEFEISKGTIKFQPEKPIPKQLVKKLVKARLKENEMLELKKRKY